MTTIQNVIDLIQADIGQEMPADTVDRIKTGNGAYALRGIAVSFMSTLAVLHKAVELGANFIITHEPTFFNHEDKQEWLADDAVFQGKKAYIDQHDLTIWRYHDGWHMHRPDGINQGLLSQLGWEGFQDKEAQYLVKLPAVNFADLAREVKEKLGASQVRTVGDPHQLCRKVLLMAGAEGGEWQIKALRESGADVLLCGEASEWQTPEYFRDAITLGMAKGLIVAGHERTEEAGMGALADWLRVRFPEIPVHHIPSGEPFSLY